MDEEPSFLQSLIGEIGEFFFSLKKKMQDDEVKRDTLLDLGLDPNNEVDLQISDESIDNIREYRESVNPDHIAFESAVNDLKKLYSAVKEFIGAVIDDPKDIDLYVWLFFEMMTTNYIRLRYPAFYWWAQLMGFVVEAKAIIKTGVKDQGLPETVHDSVRDSTHYVITELPRVIIEQIWEFITGPIQYVENAWENFIKPRKLSGHLETFESAENLSQLMLILAGLFTAMGDKLPESRYLYGWSELPREFGEDSKAAFKTSVLGKLLLNSLRKEFKTEFPDTLSTDKTWIKIEKILTEVNSNDVEKKILAEKILAKYKHSVERWKRGDWSDLVSERAFSFDLKFPVDKDSPFDNRFGSTMFFVSDEEISEHFNKDSDIKFGSLGGLFISLNGEVNHTKKYKENWELKTKVSSGNLLDVYLSRQQDANILGDMQLEMSLKRKTDPETGASYNLPDKSGTRLAIGEIKISAFLNKEDGGIEIGLKDNAVVISGGDGDGFISKIMPSGEVPLKFTVAAGFSKKKRFYVDHNIDALKDTLGLLKDDKDKDESKPVAPTPTARTLVSGLAAADGDSAAEAENTVEGENKDKEKQPFELLIPLHKDLGLLYFDSVSWDYGPTKKKNRLGAYLKVLTTFSTKLGPVAAKIEKTGLGIELTTPTQEGDLEEGTNFNFGFAPPKGVALRVDSKILTGGGYLQIDHENHRYAGVLALKLALKSLDIELIAIGLINTRLPNSEKGFSMLISISVLFNPGWQLSFGFTLNGVGGIVGIHRTMKVDVLKERVKNGAMKSIMFPENVIENASKIISDLRAVFPPQKSHHVVGLFFKFGYSTPTILEVDLGVLLEFPFNGRLILLGSLAVYLPNKDVKKRLVEIHVDVLGDFNFGASYIMIEGKLRDSHIAGVPLSGGFAFVLDWGTDPQFLLSVGGYHPRYTRPARFPSIDRLTALIKKGESFRLSCQYYQAITSNSYQIGISAEVVYKKGKIKAFGFMGFNALLQRDPFYFEADIKISVSVIYRGRSFLGVDLEFMLSGPEPWRARGYAKIKVLFLSFKVKFNISWGGEQKVALAYVTPNELLEKLQLQLQQVSNWSGKLPAQYGKAESLRSLEETESQDQIFMHPSGHLELRQNLIPLNKTINKLGNTHIKNRTNFKISKYAFANSTPIDPNTQKPLLDYFSRGQFEELQDSEKLSTPDFELMSAGIQVAPDEIYDISQEDLESTANDFEDILLDDTGITKTKSNNKWQGQRLMNLGGGVRHRIEAASAEQVYGVIDALPELQEKAYKILSKDTLEAPGQLKDQYFYSYSGAKDYLQSNWASKEQGQLQIVQTETVAEDTAVVV